MTTSLLVLGLLVGSANASGPEVGGEFPSLVLQDQFQQPWAVSSTTQAVYLAASREAGQWMTTVLSQQQPGYLESRNAMYMADLSAMPGFVTTMFALPSLRQQPYKVGVVLEEGQVTDWSALGKDITKFGLNNMRIESIEHLDTVQAVRQSLGL